MNNVIFMGRIATDPIIRRTPGENSRAVASFAIAVPRAFKRENGPEADFFYCTAWGKLAEHIEKYWRKGMKALITGSIENEQYTDREGQKKTSTKVIVDSIEFCEKKQEQEEQKADENGFMTIPDSIDSESLPFTF